MLTKLTHTTLMVHDQDEALAYYVDKLGFEKRSDAPMPEMGAGARWVTIGIKGQPDVEIILQATTWGLGGDTAEQRAALVGKGPGFIFETDDVRQDYETLKARGVQFMGEPTEFPWGTQAVMADLYGNMHVLSQSSPG